MYTNARKAQHRALNGFLNKALIATQAAKPTAQSPIPPPNDRVRMDYKHTRETDTFFDLSQSGIFALPQSLTSVTNHPRSGAKTKVRITHDQKTGKELAKIVKARIADLDIYSPQNQADWRISVNVEMDFQGDMRDLIELDKRDGKRADRSKDRMSYRHQAYQIDLTQVTAAEVCFSSDLIICGKFNKDHVADTNQSGNPGKPQGARTRDRSFFGGSAQASYLTPERGDQSVCRSHPWVCG